MNLAYRTALMSGVASPSLSLDFTSGVLDPRITFSRASNAMVTDSTGKLTYAPNNLVTYSEQFDNAAWVKTGATVTANATTAPNGTLTADKMIGTGSNPFMSTSIFIAGTKYVYSLYAKASELNWIRLTNGSAGINSAWFNVSTGTVGTIVGSGNTATITSVGNGWYRCVFVVTAANSVTGGAVIACTNADNTTSGYTGNSVDGVFIWGAQLEAVTYQTSPSTYVPTTASAYYGPRFDYDPVTLASKGLLIEEQRTNLATYSEQFDNAAWVKSSTAVTADAITAPNGTLTADKLADSNTVTNQHVIYQQPSALANTAYTLSVYAKLAEYNFFSLQISTVGGTTTRYTAVFDLTNGTTTTTNSTASPISPFNNITAVGNGWYRCTIGLTTTATTTSIYATLQLSPTGTPTFSAGSPSYTGIIGNGVYIWGAQLEAGSFATSYIPTVASSVTRSADIASMTGSNFSSWYRADEGTICFEAEGRIPILTFSNANSGYSNYRSVFRQAALANQPLRISEQNAGVTSVNNMDIGNTNALPVKVAYAYKTDNFAGSLNGASPVTDTSGIPALAVDRMGISLDFGVSSSWVSTGTYKSIRYYRTRLPNNILQQLTR